LVEGFFRSNRVSDMGELQNILREMKRQMIEGSLEGELEGELGYTRYDYRNKETDNSRSW
jgi:hypothetical protein